MIVVVIVVSCAVSLVKLMSDVEAVDDIVGTFVESVRVNWIVVDTNCVVSVADSDVPKNV